MARCYTVYTERIRKSYRISICYAVVVGGLFGAAMLLFGREVPSLYLLYICSWLLTGAAEYIYFRRAYRKTIL